MSPAGDDRGPGTPEAPLRTLGAAVALSRRADVVRLLPGVHRGRPAMIGGPVRIEGAPTATIAAPVFVGADGVVLRDLVLLRGLRVGLAEGVAVEQLRIRPGDEAETLGIHRSKVRLVDVALDGASETALQLTTATVSATGLRVYAASSRHGIRVEGGRLAIEGARIDGGEVATVQATDAGGVELRRAFLGPTRGNGLLVLDGATATVSESWVADAGSFGLLARRARLHVVGSTVSRPGAAAVGVTGGFARIEGGRLDAGREAAVVLAAHRGRAPEVQVRGTRLVHGPGTGLLVQAGRAEIVRVRFAGEVGTSTAPPAVSAPVILAHGPDAMVEIDGAELDHPAGAALAAHDDAGVHLHGVTVTAPGGDGIVLEELRARPPRLVDVRVRGCRGGGAGVRALGTEDLLAVRLDVAGCAAGGALLGDGSTARVQESTLIGGRFGLAVFGGSSARVSTSTLAGDRWAMFATCSDGARVLDAGDNRLDGPASQCP